MFGLGRSDQVQINAVEKFRNSMASVNGKYVYSVGAEGAVLLTEEQRDLLVERYAELLNGYMWFLMGVTISGLIGYSAASIALDEGKPHFWVILIIMLVGTAPAFMIRPRLRRWVAEQGIMPTLPQERVREIQRRKLKSTSWKVLLGPMIVLPFVAMRLGFHIPPRNGDDVAGIVFVVAIIGVCVWAVLRKVAADKAEA